VNPTRPAAAPPPFLPTSALSLELDGFVAVTAAMHAGFAEARSTFECTLPQLDPNVGFFVLAGIDPLLDALERFKLKSDELVWLESIGAIDANSKKRLTEMRFSCDVDAAPEGSVVFPGAPVLVIEGPFWQAQIVSAVVRAALGAPTLAATKAARCALAADGCEIIESAAATMNRLGGNPQIARAAYVGGASATTCALAARRYRIPVRASLPLRYAHAAGDEKIGFESWLKASQDRAILRIDHRNARESIDAAIAAVKERAQSSSWHDQDVAIEIGGGDLADLAALAIESFKNANLPEPVLVGSGRHLDEFAIADYRTREAPFSAFIVSCMELSKSGDGDWNADFDLSAIERGGQWAPRMRVGKNLATSSDPGRKVILRYVDADERPVADVACATNERIGSAKDLKFVDRATGFPTRLKGAKSSAPLLSNVMRNGKRVTAMEDARRIRERVSLSLSALHERFKRLRAPAIYPVGATASLASLKDELIADSRGS
jgi:nicotinate phosphoribosyltransferase